MNSEIGAKEVDFNPFGSKTIEKIIPSISPQKEIWIACKVGGQGANLSYLQSLSLLFKGNLDKDALEKAIDALLEGHEILRSCFSGDGESLIVYGEPDKQYTFLDLSDSTPEERDRSIDEFYTTNAYKEFDLTQGPLIRFCLIQKGEDDYVFNVTAHHIVCDGWSLGVIIEEMGKNYSLVTSGKSPEVNKELDFGDYAHRIIQFENTSRYSEVNNYWVKKFEDHSRDLDLPIDFPRPSARTYKGHREDFILESRLVSGIREMVKETGCSAVNILLSCLEITLSKITGQHNIVIGLPVAGQVVNGDFTLIGHCVNLLPVKSHLDPSATLRDYLQVRRDGLLTDLEHQEFTFGNLLEVVQKSRDFSRVPLVPLVFNIDLGMERDVHFAGLDIKLRTDPREYENFEIFLNVSGNGDALTFEWTYNTGLFSLERIKSFMDAYKKVLSQIIANGSLEIREITSGVDAQTPHSAAVIAEGDARPEDAQTAREAGRRRPPHSASFSSEEERMVYAWSSVLGVKNIKKSDNFFNLGGNSLAAIKTVAQLETDLKKPIPIVTLFRFPVFQDFVSAVLQMATPTADDSEDSNAHLSWDSLVPIKPEGSKHPIYIVHGGGLNVSPFYNLIGRLDPEQPIYGIQARGINGIDTPFYTIERMAAHYVQEVVSQNPHGPYNIAGYSFGGVIAFEMAQQLRSQGKVVKKLILFDTFVNFRREYTKKWQPVWAAIRDEIGKRGIELNLLINHTEIFKQKKVKSYHRKKNYLLDLLGIKKQVPKEGVFALYDKIIDINQTAVIKYDMKRYDGQVYLFRAKIWDYYDTDLKYLGWKNYVDDVVVIEAEGKHEAMFDVEHVDVLAARLQQILDS